jgi:hypothetical protein
MTPFLHGIEVNSHFAARNACLAFRMLSQEMGQASTNIREE